MKAEDYAERTLEVAGWPLRVTSYRIGETWYATADNVSPGAWFARAEGTSRAAAEEKAVETARRRLERTRRFNNPA
jgi:hypothetical protein